MKGQKNYKYSRFAIIFSLSLAVLFILSFIIVPLSSAYTPVEIEIDIGGYTGGGTSGDEGDDDPLGSASDGTIDQGDSGGTGDESEGDTEPPRDPGDGDDTGEITDPGDTGDSEDTVDPGDTDSEDSTEIKDPGDTVDDTTDNQYEIELANDQNDDSDLVGGTNDRDASTQDSDTENEMYTPDIDDYNDDGDEYNYDEDAQTIMDDETPEMPHHRDNYPNDKQDYSEDEKDDQQDEELDTDKDGIPDIMDEDSDGDGFSDILEEEYGSDPKNSENTPIANIVNSYLQENSDEEEKQTYMGSQNKRNSNFINLGEIGESANDVAKGFQVSWPLILAAILGVILLVFVLIKGDLIYRTDDKKHRSKKSNIGKATTILQINE